jgi:hypothetical protein
VRDRVRAAISRIKAECYWEVGRALQLVGYTQAQALAIVDGLLRKPSLHSSLPASLAELFKKAQAKAFERVTQEINRWPEIALKPETSVVRAPIDLVVTPDSVHLLVIRPR